MQAKNNLKKMVRRLKPRGDARYRLVLVPLTSAADALAVTDEGKLISVLDLRRLRMKSRRARPAALPAAVPVSVPESAFVSERSARHSFSFARAFRGSFRAGLTFGRKGLAGFLVFGLILIQADAFVAFEAHIINVTAEMVQIDPPVISPPGGQYSNTLQINITDSDPDATHIFYTMTPGTDPGAAPDPQCGVLPGGPKPIGPIDILDDTVVKAIACDADSVLAHKSLITVEIYDLTLFGRIEGRKYHDLDKSGTLTGGDFPIEGWRVDLLVGTSTVSSTVTDVTGYYAFPNAATGTYNVVEESRAGWQHITASSTQVVLSAGETEAVDFFNFDTGFSCVPVPINFPANLAVQAAGATASSSNDDIVMHSNTDIFGDARSNDEIEGTTGGANRIIHGNATVVNTIDASVNVTGTAVTGAATASLPDAMIPFWQAQAASGGTVNGSFTFPNNTVGLVMGPTEILGNLTFGSSNGVTIKGPIYVHGNLSIGSGSTINQDAGFGNQFAVIVVDGEINIDSNITFNGAGTIGTFLLISTHAAITGDNAAIETSSNNSDLGDVVLYASNGDIHINSNRTLLAVFAAHGTGVDTDANGAIRLESNVDVVYRTLPATASCGARQPFESTSHVLINEFMPNPSGTDTGVAGLPLDGEWVELFNPTAGTVDVAGYVLYDSVNTNELFITNANTNTGGTTIPSLGYLVVYREGDGDFELNNATPDSVRLFNAEIGLGGVLVDSHAYVAAAPDNKSFARIPDGAANWIDPDATPGAPNLFFFEIAEGITFGDVFDPPDLPLLVIEEPAEEPVIEAPQQEEVVVVVQEGEGEEEVVAPADETTSASEETVNASSTDGNASSTPVDTATSTASSTPGDAGTEESSAPAEPTDTQPAPESSSDDPSGDGSTEVKTEEGPALVIEAPSEEPTPPPPPPDPAPEEPAPESPPASE